MTHYICVVKNLEQHIASNIMGWLWMSYLSHMNESCLTYEGLTSRMWMSHGTHLNESCLTHVRHDSFIRETELTHMCEVSHSYVRHDSFIWETRLIHTCAISYSRVNTSCLFVGLFCKRALLNRQYSAKETWLIHISYSHVRHASFIRETWLIHKPRKAEYAQQKPKAKYLEKKTLYYDY